MIRTKQPNRPHFIPEWAERRKLKQADIARALDADKSVVSRWFNGATPSEDYQHRLADLLIGDADSPESLFRHPDDDWIVKFFRDRPAEEVERIKATLEAAFPPRNRAA